jgi:hypothetical protein
VFKCISNIKTKINDENSEIIKIDMKKHDWMPNSNINIINDMTNNDKKLNILCDFSYSRLDKKNVSKNETNIFKYPLIYLTPKKGVRLMYSSRNDRGHYNIRKVIIGETGMDNAINDFDGKYGMTQDSFGIIINNKSDGDKIIKVLKVNKYENY